MTSFFALQICSLASERLSIETDRMTYKARDDGAADIARLIETMAASCVSAQDASLWDTQDCGEGDRCARRRSHLFDLVARLLAKGFDCSLLELKEGDYEYAEVTYRRPGERAVAIRQGWRAGEDENRSLAYTWLILELMLALGS